MTRKFYIRSNKFEGQSPTYDLMHGGVKLGEMSYLELMELLAQIALSAADKERK